MKYKPTCMKNNAYPVPSLFILLAWIIQRVSLWSITIIQPAAPQSLFGREVYAHKTLALQMKAHTHMHMVICALSGGWLQRHSVP